MQIVSSSLRWAIALLVSLWISLSAIIQLLVILMALDFATGVMLAMKKRELEAHQAWLGLMKKTAVLIVTGTVFLLQGSLAKAQGIHIPLQLGELVAGAYVVSEFISVIQNCGQLGAPIPAVLRRTLKSLEAQEGGGDQAKGASA